MKIEKYTCDLCGISVDNLTNIEEFTFNCAADNYNKTFTYYVCPFCASMFKKINDNTMEQILLHHLRRTVDKDNV